MIGPFTRRLTLEERAAAPDGAGGLEEIWVEVAALWAALRATGARERAEGHSEAAKVSHRAEVRWAPPGALARPRPDQRLREGERLYAIRGVAEADDRRERLVLWLEEGALS